MLTSNNFIKVHIYYGELKTEQIEQSVAYTLENFFSELYYLASSIKLVCWKYSFALIVVSISDFIFTPCNLQSSDR
jgi:hypothetical protein